MRYVMNVYAPLRIRRFIRLLGWPRPTYGRHVVRGSLEPKQDGMILRWYDSGNYDYALLEINLQPNVRACVFAIRYRLCTGWYEISPGIETGTQLVSVHKNIAIPCEVTGSLPPWMAMGRP